ncbi:MAG: hypothetical protein HY057_09070 [Rhodospirillales bacterium]|nr:hypothetical protein [Rhodospirillales bacterium]
MRRTLAMSLAAALLLTLALGLVSGCGKKNEPDPPGGPNSTFGRPYPRS